MQGPQLNMASTAKYGSIGKYGDKLEGARCARAGACILYSISKQTSELGIYISYLQPDHGEIGILFPISYFHFEFAGSLELSISCFLFPEVWLGRSPISYILFPNRHWN